MKWLYGVKLKKGFSIGVTLYKEERRTDFVLGI